MPAAIPIAAAVVGGAIASNATKKAAKTQAAAADRASELQNDQYEQTRQDQLALLERQRTDAAPYREAGYGALSQLVGGTAPGGEFNREYSMDDIMRNRDPGYQFRVDEGERGINRAATASGSRYSGATLKALSRFNSGLASQEAGAAHGRFKSDLGDRFNRLSGLAGTGQAAVTQAGKDGTNAYGTIAQLGANNASNQGTAAQNAAEARASGYVGTANAVNGVIGQGVNAYRQNQYLSQMNGGLGYTPPPDYGQERNFSGYDAQANGGWGIE